MLNLSFFLVQKRSPCVNAFMPEGHLFTEVEVKLDCVPALPLFMKLNFCRLFVDSFQSLDLLLREPVVVPDIDI